MVQYEESHKCLGYNILCDALLSIIRSQRHTITTDGSSLGDTFR